MNDGENIDVARLQFEREKWAADLRLRERELDLREEEQRQARWRSPLTVAIFAAALAAAGNAVVAFVNGNSQRDLEDGKAESERILEMIKTGDPDSAADNLQFLLDSGLIADQTRVAKLASYLKTRGAGTGPALPAAGGIKFDKTQELTQDLQDKLESGLKDYLAYLEKIGLAHDLPGLIIRIQHMESPNTNYFIETHELVIDDRLAPDLSIATVAAAQYALAVMDKKTCRQDVCQMISGGLADYFAASYANRPQIAEASAPVFQSNQPFLRNLDNDLKFDAAARLNIYSGGEVWGGAFWEIRTKLGQQVADRVLAQAWNSPAWQGDAARGADAFVRAILAAAGDNAAPIGDILRGRGFPVIE
jgi:hypothetical protein